MDAGSGTDTGLVPDFDPAELRPTQLATMRALYHVAVSTTAEGPGRLMHSNDDDDESDPQWVSGRVGYARRKRRRRYSM